jgi:hypothetical protein
MNTKQGKRKGEKATSGFATLLLLLYVLVAVACAPGGGGRGIAAAGLFNSFFSLMILMLVSW